MSALAFDVALDVVWVNEGVDSDHPSDPGGRTRYGISQAAYPDLHIATLTREQAAEIYRRDYWQAIHGDELPLRIAVQVFDHAVNAGVEPAIRLLQSVVGVTADGRMGPQTIAAARSKAAQGGEVGVALADERLAFYRGLVQRKPGLGVFARGWQRRVLRTLRVAELAEAGIVADL